MRTLSNAVIQEKVGVVINSSGTPRHYTELLRRNGIKVLHLVSSIKQAKTAESFGIYGVIAKGVEAAGSIGFDEMPGFPWSPRWLIRSLSLLLRPGGLWVEGAWPLRSPWAPRGCTGYGLCGDP